jgi:hypothetical protein
MMTESEHMVVGDDVSGDDGGEDLKTPLSGVKSRTNLTPEMKIVDIVALCFTKGYVILDT